MPNANTRDIAHEQVSASTDAELLDRMAVIISRGCSSLMFHNNMPIYTLAESRELGRIRSELYARENRLESFPNRIYVPPVDWKPLSALDRDNGMRFASVGRRVMQGDEEWATCKSGTAADRIANALNWYKPGKRGA